MTRKFLDLESNCVLVSNPLEATGNKSSHVFWSTATTFEGKVLKILASLFRDYSFSLVMADEDWAAEVDEQEREISGQVSCYCIMTETRAITILKLSRWSVVVALFSLKKASNRFNTVSLCYKLYWSSKLFGSNDSQLIILTSSWQLVAFTYFLLMSLCQPFQCRHCICFLEKENNAHSCK